jgi:hypothetical protein
LPSADLNRIIVDTTVQPKNVMFPTDAKLLNRAREILVRLATSAASSKDAPTSLSCRAIPMMATRLKP